MSSDAKIAANRNNARKSTGPRSARGKGKSKFNAVKSGIYAKTQILPGEDEDAYRELERETFDTYAPVGQMETMYVREIIAEYWKLERNSRAAIACHDQTREGHVLNFLRSLNDSEIVHVRSNYKAEIGDQIKQHQREVEAAYLNAGGPDLEYVDPAEYAPKLDANGQNEIRARLDLIRNPDNTVLAGLVPKSESAPQTFLARERRVIVRTIGAYHNKLMDLQEARLTVTLVSQPTVTAIPAKLVIDERNNTAIPHPAANQNQQKSGNNN